MPRYFLERRTGEDYPPPVTHPEHYGSLGVTLAWQFLFLVIASDPVRYRPAMREKASFAAAIPLLYAAGRVAAVWVGFAAMDAAWLALFVAAYLRTPQGGKPGADGRGRAAA